MSYKKEVLENKEVKFTFEVSKEDWQEAIEQAYQKSKGKFNIDGFRTGKAPKRKIEALYGASVFFEEALDIVIPKYYGDALKVETEVHPVGYPDINVVAISDSTLTFTASVAVKPEITLGAYKGLKLKKIKADVGDEEVNAKIDADRDKAGAWENITDRAAKNGDNTIIDYSGSVGGKVFEGGTAEKQSLVLGGKMFIPGFEEQVEGMKIGDKKDIKVKFPDEYGSEDLAGKEAIFAVTLHEIKVKKLPQVNDDFVKDVSEFNTVSEYKANIKSMLEKQKTTKAEMDMENALIEEIAKGCKVDIPDAMIEMQVDDMVEEFEYRLTYQGMKIDDYYKYTHSSRDELKSKYVETAKKQVLVRLVMEAIIKAEKIEVSESEIDGRLTTIAEGGKKTLADYKKTVTKEQLNYIKNELVTDKLLDFLKSNNKFA